MWTSTERTLSDDGTDEPCEVGVTMAEQSIAELEEMVGESKVTITGLDIEAGTVDEFARAIIDDNPAFRSERAAKEQGSETIPAPLTLTRISLYA